MPNQETTPLLSDHHVLPLHAGAAKAEDPPSIDFGAAHSVWPWLSQRALLFLRGGLLVYLTAVTPVLFQYKVAEHAAKRPDSMDNFNYTLLYTAAHIANVMNAIIYWAILVPHSHDGSSQGQALGECWRKSLSIVHLYSLSPVIASSEVVFLNSIEHQRPLLGHFVSVITKLVAAYASGFVAMGAAAFAAMYILTSLRDKAASHLNQRGQYIQIVDEEDDEAHGVGPTSDEATRDRV
ncbi:hypothetical protein N0V88_006866 [Collariella sp. IMI 366227]|nr:hypothetical protein N0V88_006866 [Collariella sp. IMI 366227]